MMASQIFFMYIFMAKKFSSHGLWCNMIKIKIKILNKIISINKNFYLIIFSKLIVILDLDINLHILVSYDRDKAYPLLKYLWRHD